MITRESLDARGEELIAMLVPSALAVIAYIVTYADYATDEDGAAEVLRDALALREVSEESVIAAEAFLSALDSLAVLYATDDSFIGAGHRSEIEHHVKKYRDKQAENAKPAKSGTANLADQKIRDFAKWAGIHTTPRLKSALRECYAQHNRNGEIGGFEDRLDRTAVRADAQSRGLAILS